MGDKLMKITSTSDCGQFGVSYNYSFLIGYTMKRTSSVKCLKGPLFKQSFAVA